MKIAIISDPLMGFGGGSRHVIALANKLNADIITSGFDNTLRKNISKHIKVIDIGNFTIKWNFSFGYLFEAPIRFLFSKIYSYDLNIYIGSFSIFGASKTKNNIWVCLTPNRIMYDLKNWKVNNSNYLKNLIYKVHILLFKNLDQRAAQMYFDKIITQSKVVQKRIKTYYQKKSEIIYAPTDTSKYKFGRIGNYFLAVSRLAEEKRMSLIARAFVKMPDKKLILIGSGLEEKRIKNIIKFTKNITLLTKVADNKLKDYYSDCKATIYMPIEEDFGLIPVESMASGKICIAANEGGCKETIINGKTGYLINATEEEIINTVNQIKESDLLKMKDDCIKRAKEFDIKVSINKWKKVISKYS